MKVNSTYKHINKFLHIKEKKIEKLSLEPLIIHWLSSSSMKTSLMILDKKVGYLLENFSVGGEGKLNQWLLSGDVNFCTLTAERYILDYLRSKNPNIDDNLKPRGVDGCLHISDKDIGIEITTLNGFIADWIFTERLSQSISSDGYLSDKTIRVKYSSSRLINEFRKHKLSKYIHQVGEAITTGNKKLLQNVGVNIEIEKRWAGCISWEIVDENESLWLRWLTEDIYNKITTSKYRQLKNYDQNIIFIGVNNISPFNWAIPLLFNELGSGGISYIPQISHIKSFWQKSLQNHENIIGICYFCFSLDSIKPFYPIKVFWRDDREKLNVNF